MILCQSYHTVQISQLTKRKQLNGMRPHGIIIELFSISGTFSFRHFIFISRQQITNPKYIISYPEIRHTHGLISTSIGLNMRINSHYFEDGVLRIKCVACISPIIWSENKETVIQQQGLKQFDIPLPSIDTREVLFLGKIRFSLLSDCCQRFLFILLTCVKIQKDLKSLISIVVLIQSIFCFMHSKIERNYNQINNSTSKCKHFIS